MIRTLQIKRFRSYANSTFNFCNGINGIIGISQSGKTNVVRAIEWLKDNRPSGSRYRSDFTKLGTSVTMLLEDQTKIQVHRSNKTTVQYELLRAGARAKHWDHVGRTVPDLVVDSLNMSSLNIQEQLDAPFLVTSAAGEIARTINRITKAEKLDKWIKNLNSKINVLKYQKQGDTTELKNITDQLKGYKRLDELDKKIYRLERVKIELRKLDKEYTDIDELLADIRDTKNTIRLQRRYLKAKKFIDQIETVVETQKELEVEAVRLDLILDTKKKVSSAKLERKALIAKYTSAISTQKKCPTCFHSVSKKDVERIVREIHSIK